MFNNAVVRILLAIPLILILSCSGGKMDDQKKVFTSIKDIPESTWKKLSEKRIYFAHQSVGFNIIDGIKDVMKDNPQIKLNIVETADPAAFNAPVFAHSKAGENTNPKSKCDAFAGFLDKGLGSKVDIAFLKFCYVDVMAETDVDRVFDDYKITMAQLKAKYPQTRFVHMTVPLTTLQAGIKASIKKIIGRPVGGYDENIKRELFSDRLRNGYGAKEPVFDLAKIESTFPDGTRSSFTKDGKTFYTMVPEYTYDGGHLNEKGRKLAAEHLLIFLANLAG